LSSDYVEAVTAISSIEALQDPAAAVPFNPDSSMGSAAPAAVSVTLTQSNMVNMVKHAYVGWCLAWLGQHGQRSTSSGE
jgi:hypothetical protein